jgi:hypothetical protein
MEKELCGHLLRCWDYHLRACVREKGHNDNGNVNAHNPFSNTAYPNLGEVTMRKTERYVRNCETEHELVSA